MMGAGDFQADQDYHRGRLARALLQLAGTGTVYGLNVAVEPPTWNGNTPYAAFALVYDAGNNLQVNTGKAGTSGPKAPVFAAAPGGSVNDANGIVWTNEGPIVTAGWRANTAFSFPTAIVDSNNNIQILSVKPNFTTGAGQPVWNATIGGPTNDGAANTAAWTCLGPMQIELAVSAGLAIDRAGLAGVEGTLPHGLRNPE